MKIFEAKQVADIDSYTIKHEPIESIDLMERAASQLAWWFTKYFKTNKKVVVVAGPGNNGGDALALARILLKRQYQVDYYVVSSSGKLSADCEKNLERLENDLHRAPKYINGVDDFPEIKEESILIEGIFGSGLTRPAGGIYGKLIRYINSCNPNVVSIDIPGGMYGEDNSSNDKETIIRAKYTLTFQFPFLSFFFAENEKYTGAWHVLDIGLHDQIIADTPALYSITERHDISAIIKPRGKFTHKGTYGHVFCAAGAYGMMGAAVLSAEAILRSGAGLVTMHIPRKGYDIMQTAFPEAIVSLDKSDVCFTNFPDPNRFTAIAVGPGLGKENDTREALKSLLKKANQPIVIDADALNIIAEDNSMLDLIPENSVLTPHPLEFDRIAGKSPNGWSRHEKQLKFSKDHKVIVVLKGAYTGISFPDGQYFFNNTGNPGMASGGSGDVLTGIIVSLIARGINEKEAAIAGAYIHGLAGDLASEDIGMESMIAGDINRFLGKAFNKVNERPYLHEGRDKL